ncbi:hypothetical protein L1049_000625 [Liquidambar formosana]|uniref:Senescence regulator n=1 Tax=Liquidambar formosana TaxID=63359 RepID=A0AAP0R4X4_LIQFO
MEDRYGYFSQGSGGWRSMRDGDFQEEDVWGVFNDRRDYSSTSRIGKSKEYSSSVSSTSRHLPAAARMIPRKVSNQSHDTKVVQQSAPVNIPDWSKIYGKNSKKASKNSSLLLDDDDDGRDSDDDEDDEDFEDDEYDSKVPPHELLARRLARTQISSFSVCEGVGRTLKGRDLSKVRNAILTKTGFLE